MKRGIMFLAHLLQFFFPSSVVFSELAEPVFQVLHHKPAIKDYLNSMVFYFVSIVLPSFYC